MWILIIGAIFLPQHEPLSKTKTIGIIISIIGLILVFIPQLNFTGNTYETLGSLAIVAATICYGILANLNKFIFSKYKSIDLTTNLFNQLISGAVILLIASITIETANAVIQV